MNHAGSRIHKFSSTLSKVIGDGGEGGIPPPFIQSVKFFVMIGRFYTTDELSI